MGIKYRKGYKYQLVEDYTCQIGIYPEKDIVTEYIELTVTGKLFIKHGYAWDGTSGPTIDGPTNMRGSLIHDTIYQLLREGLLKPEWRKQADCEFEKACKEDGMCDIRRYIDLKGLRYFAGYAADPRHDRKIYEAPLPFNKIGNKK
ncbi:MAG: hypothetical protein M0P71_15105 [Melioribacteraceae bacterium]|jgi:hypothetical protein|nr:hypothetical protein [Melioribacteraceae bacterium]